MTTQPTHFTIIPDFNTGGPSANGGRCYFTGIAKQKKRTPQQQPHEVDDFILRGPEIDFEGFLDIRPCVIIDTAREVFDMRDAEEVAGLQSQIASLQAQLREEQDRRTEADERLQQMILINAELIVTGSSAEADVPAYEELLSPDALRDAIDGQQELF